MDYSTFERLDTSSQFLILWRYGVFLYERDDDHFKYRLYQLDCFYVEEKWNRSTNFRESIFAFTNIEYLDLYLSRIEIIF